MSNHAALLQCIPSRFLQRCQLQHLPRFPVSPALVEDDDNNDVPLPTLPSRLAPDSSKMPSPDVELSVLSNHLKRLTDAVNRLTSAPTPAISSSPPPLDIDAEEPLSPLTGEPTDSPTSWLLSTMTSEEITRLLHHPGTMFPSVHPCNTANSSDTKTHWSVEDLHRIMGCRKFHNYKHLLQFSCNGEWVDGGEFPSSLGSYASIPKAKRGGTLDRMMYLYLDAVHMDIAFGDCVAVGSYCYALILVDHATRYNWTFSLKTLSSTDIILALRLFCAAAGCLACTFYSDCDLKLFGSAVSEYLIDGQSKVIAALAKRQSANGLVKSHWKTMVHMACAYITEKQMPRTFWFYAITHAARMMNAILGKHSSKLASPFLLVHGVGHDERTWVSIFSLAFFHHEKDGDV
jgi:hypothetical protein